MRRQGKAGAGSGEEAREGRQRSMCCCVYVCVFESSKRGCICSEGKRNRISVEYGYQDGLYYKGVQSRKKYQSQE